MTAEKVPPKRKIPKLGEIKKPLIIGGIIAAIAVAGIIVGINIYSETQPKTLIFGVFGCPYIIDPLATLYARDVQMINQVAEGLFEVDVKSNNSDIIYNLAIDHTWSDDALNLTCTLRKGVKFHDETPFNATAVKWNFDRIHRLINDKLMAYPDVWLLPNNQTIINQTQVLDEYTVRFVLNAPYVPLMGLLTSWTSFILSPASTPEDDFIDVLTGDLVGTGPFIYDSIAWEGSLPINVSLSANPHYWGDKPKIDKLFFRKIEMVPGSQFPMKQSLSSGEVHLAVNPYFNESTIDEFRSISSFTVQEGILLSEQHWIAMNNKLINTTMRKAISYAFNYSSIIELAPHLWIKPKSPIPEGLLYHNTTGINIPYCSISKARQVLKDVNWNNTAGALPADDNVSAGNEWETIANSPTPLAIYNFSWKIGWGGGYDFVFADLTEALTQIGVKLERVNVTPAKWDYQVYESHGYHRNMYHFTILGGWTADYNDPSTVINALYTNKRIGLNIGQVNDTQLEQWMDDALVKSDPIARGHLYYEIQKRIIEEIYPNIWFWQFIRTDVYVSNLRGWYPNGFKDLFKFVYFA